MSGRWFQKVLVANRGEIAIRVMRTCRVHGIGTVAVFSEVDADAPHVREADEAVLIGPAEATASYLDVSKIIAAAELTGADAVHPGYGFLSENVALAQACADAGITFVGPPADVLAGSGDKLVVKQRVAAHGVPVIPGPLSEVPEDPDLLRAAADETGYPLLLKAIAGGGGKGMRRVERPADVIPAAEGARREAGGAFGNTALYLERMIEGARHVEVQVVCDELGGVAVLGERDCSTQRRHQKVLEECPAPGLSDDVRRAVHEAGANAARALGYRGAGTVELLLRDDGFWFLEMNRRLQVEHPVTEMCFGVDLVAWQLAVAAGEPLPEVPAGPLGHAIEARVYAEDPANEFLPSPGEIVHVREPEGPGIRVDAALEAPMTVSPFYDPLLAKVIAHGETREEALLRLDRALADTVVMGVKTNVGFLRRLLSDEAFSTASMRVDDLDRRGDELTSARVDVNLAILAAAADALLPGGRRRRRAGDGPAAVPSPWSTLSGFRLGGTS